MDPVQGKVIDNEFRTMVNQRLLQEIINHLNRDAGQFVDVVSQSDFNQIQRDVLRELKEKYPQAADELELD